MTFHVFNWNPVWPNCSSTKIAGNCYSVDDDALSWWTILTAIKRTDICQWWEQKLAGKFFDLIYWVQNLAVEWNGVLPTLSHDCDDLLLSFEDLNEPCICNSWKKETAFFTKCMGSLMYQVYKKSRLLVQSRSIIMLYWSPCLINWTRHHNKYCRKWKITVFQA